MKQFGVCMVALALLLAVRIVSADPPPKIRVLTDMGTIEIELYPDKAPITVKNFLEYVDSGFYDGTIFHRVISESLIQGGGYTPGMKEKPTRPPIDNEAENGLKNVAGTVAMGRERWPLSATSQFFINTVDNPEFDFRYNTIAGWGYCVFGRVTRGMDVVRKIERVETRFWPFEERPVQDVVIRKIERLQ
jgi:cyclophilin family peptidyl-prolyl cis-trans isomerase